MSGTYQVKKASPEAMALALMGTVTKIEGKKITIKQDDGKETTVEVKDVKGIKVRDRVKVKVERGV
jgi:preprotein translocase subunit YajC